MSFGLLGLKQIRNFTPDLCSVFQLRGLNPLNEQSGPGKAEDLPIVLFDFRLRILLESLQETREPRLFAGSQLFLI